MRLNKLHIKGFKDPEREVNIVFSKTPISVVYGENGSGKTTLLKIIHAIFNKDDKILINENVYSIDLEFEDEHGSYVNVIEVEGGKVDWGESWGLGDSNSILFGVNRGILKRMRETEIIQGGSERNQLELFDVWDKKPILTHVSTVKHPNLDFVPVEEVRSLIVDQYEKAEEAVSEKVKNAFFNTIANAVEIEIDKVAYNLPENFWARLDSKRDFLLKNIENLDKSSLQKRVLGLLENKEATVPDSNIFKALLVNILEKSEEKNLDLQSINKLIEIFNSHLYGEKKLMVNREEAYIALPRNRRHELKDLSSGERHLLTFLALFLIIGRGRDFYLIDEPEISLSMKWQRDLMPLLSELSPESQIIVATHSPSIANHNTDYLVELV